MEYVVYRRFKAEGIDGAFNLRYGTTVTERDGFLLGSVFFRFFGKKGLTNPYGFVIIVKQFAVA